MKGRVIQVMRGLCIAALCAVISVNGASAVQNGGVGGRPANPDPKNPRTQSIFIYTVDRSASVRDEVLVSNNSSDTQRIKLYAVDGVVTNTGAYTCRQAAEALQDLGAWITVSQPEITLTPGQSEKVGFTLSVPANADVGEHNACLAFENADDEGEAVGSVRVHTRQAIRVAVTVPGTLHREVTITNFSAVTQPKSQQYQVSLKNKGNVSADVDTHVVLKSLFGTVIGDTGGSYPVLANQKLDLQLETTARPLFGGWYKAVAEVRYDKKAGAFGLSEDKRQLLTKYSQTELLFLMPTAFGGMILGVLVVVIAGLSGWYWVRRRQAVYAAKHWVKYEVKVGETLEDVAKKSGENWRVVARHNHLKPPYGLSEGQIILLPGKKQTKAQAGSGEAEVSQ